ncbi:hypothetical protein D0T66_10810 [Dysgonomonas sp. 25]|nr:hypothetical protein [Dysgonomonas sp. 25]
MVSCTEDMKFKNAKVTPVETLYEPVDGKTLLLDPQGSSYFSWEPARTEDSGPAIYEIIFDKLGGDFSNPLYVMPSDGNGSLAGVSVSHKILSLVAELNGVDMGESTTVIWTVRSSRGINTAISSVHRELSYTRLAGFTPEQTPAELYITGTGSEAGTNLSDAIPFKNLGKQIFEIYTELNSGQTYQLVSKTSTSDPDFKTFYIDGLIKQSEHGTESGTVTQTSGIYHIVLDFSTASVTFTEIQRVEFYFCPTGATEWPLAYQGKGIWKGTGPVTFKQESWGRDQRYKFRVTTATQLEDWGPENAGEDGTPSGAAEYYNLAIYTPVNQWDHKWKFASAFDGANVTLTVYMQGDGVYRHTVE